MDQNDLNSLMDNLPDKSTDQSGCELFLETAEEVEKYRIINLSGHSIAVDAVDFENQIRALGLFDQKKDIIIDMSGCRYLSSFCFAVVFEVATQMLENKLKICIININPKLEFILQTLEGGALIKVCESKEAALDYLSGT